MLENEEDSVDTYHNGNDDKSSMSTSTILDPNELHILLWMSNQYGMMIQITYPLPNQKQIILVNTIQTSAWTPCQSKYDDQQEFQFHIQNILEAIL